MKETKATNKLYICNKKSALLQSDSPVVFSSFSRIMTSSFSNQATPRFRHFLGRL